MPHQINYIFLIPIFVAILISYLRKDEQHSKKRQKNIMMIVISVVIISVCFNLAGIIIKRLYYKLLKPKISQ